MPTHPVPDEPDFFCSAARLRLFDGNYEVLHGHQIAARNLDARDTVRLAELLAVWAPVAKALENEPMTLPRFEIWCTHRHRRIGAFVGGLLP